MGSGVGGGVGVTTNAVGTGIGGAVGIGVGVGVGAGVARPLKQVYAPKASSRIMIMIAASVTVLPHRHNPGRRGSVLFAGGGAFD